MLNRLIQQRQAEDAEAKRREDLYPDEAEHACQSVVSFWRCRCGKVNALVLEEGRRKAKCECQLLTPLAYVKWHDRPVI